VICRRGKNGHRKTLLERYNDHVEKGEECWLWQGAIGEHGYGYISIGGHRVKQAHRVAYELFIGPIPEGKCVLHRCDTRACVRPDHFFLGTPLTNAQDRDGKGRGNAWGWRSGRKQNEHGPGGRFLKKSV
jgi:HNH endonuclease